MRFTLSLALASLCLSACSRPTFEQFETRISATVSDPKTGKPKLDESGKAFIYSAVVKAYINNTDNSVNFELTNPSPSWTLQCQECSAALFAEARRVTEAAYPHLAPLTVK